MESTEHSLEKLYNLLQNKTKIKFDSYNEFLIWFNSKLRYTVDSFELILDIDEGSTAQILDVVFVLQPHLD